MAQKCLSIIQDFTTNELLDFIKKNGYGEYEEILISGNITDGEKFLGLNELQIAKWKLPPASRKKLWSFLTEVKENPQKFVMQADAELKSATYINRRQSFTKTNDNFKKQLELVIGPRAPYGNVAMNKLHAPTPKEAEPINEYLPMSKEDEAEGHYDDGTGYLIPVGPPTTQEENDYEPSPSTRVVTNFVPSLRRENTNPIANRAPIAPPRESTDERQYILGPNDLATSVDRNNDPSPSFFPRFHSPKNVPFKPKMSSPSPTKEIPKLLDQSEIENSIDEEVAYEPIDYGDDINFINTTNNEQMNADTEYTDSSDGSTISRFFDLFKKGSNSGLPTSKSLNNVKDSSFEPEQNNTTAVKSSEGISVERAYSIRDRPLPPLPGRQSPRVQQKPKPTASGRTYANVRHSRNTSLSEKTTRKLRPPSPEKLEMQGKFNSEKSKSENDLASNNVGKAYRNASTKPSKNIHYPENYEKHIVQSSKYGKSPLPLPPNTLPQIPLPAHIDNEDEEDIDDDYDNTGLSNFNNESFYRNTDRKGARLLLYDLEDGAFLFRPSKTFFLTLSLKYDDKYINLGIEKTENNNIRLKTEGEGESPEFATLRAFVAHFTTNLLTFQHQGKVVEIYLEKLLPIDRF